MGIETLEQYKKLRQESWENFTHVSKVLCALYFEGGEKTGLTEENLCKRTDLGKRSVHSAISILKNRVNLTSNKGKYFLANETRRLFDRRNIFVD